MLIPDTLRQEKMPMMVYYLCKLVNYGEYSEGEICELLSAFGDKKSREQVNTVYSFCKEGMFISEKDNGIITTSFADDELIDFRHFMLAVNTNLQIDENNKFIKCLKWLFQQDENISQYTSAESFMAQIIKASDVDLNYIHGFLFWINALGYTLFDGYRSGAVTFCMDELLINYFKNNKDKWDNNNMTVRSFLKKMERDIPVIRLCHSDNTICYALAQALIILKQVGFLYYEYESDSDDNWMLTNSTKISTIRIN